MSEDKSLIKRFFDKNLPKKENNKKEVKIAIPPNPRGSYLGQKSDTRRAEEYKNTIRAVEGVVRATEDLEIAVGDLNNVDTKIEANKNGFLAELKESKQKLEDLYKNDELREEQRKTRIMQERSSQGRAEAEIIESEANKAENRLRIAEAEEKAKRLREPPAPQPKPKTMADRINEKDKKINKIRETITAILQKNLIAIEEEGKLRGLTEREIEEKKDLERARWAKIEMEEIAKVERNYR